MSDETETTVATPQTEQTESSAQTPAKETTDARKPAGYHPVDVKEATPEEIQDRLDYLYKQAKSSKKSEKELRSLRDVAAEQSRLISELTNGMNTVVDHLQEKQITESESTLKAQKQAALDSGDTKAYVEADDKLAELKAQKIAAKEKKTAAKSETQKQAFAGEKVAQKETFEGDITQQEAVVIKSWMSEKDERNRPLRPWIDDADPDYDAAVAETQSVFKNPRFSNLSIDQKLAEVDRRMGVAKQSGGQNVLGGNLTTRTKNNKVALSAKQQEIAVKTRYAGKGKSEADHIEAYRKQIEKVQEQRRGAR